MTDKRTGLIMEGGAMRGMFTCGVTDVLMENGIEFDGAVGVSAGATFGCNYKSKQIGRARRYNEKYCGHPKYGSFKSFFKTGNIFDTEFCYHDIPFTLDPFDTKTFKENPMEFHVVCTDAKTGKPYYYKCVDGLEQDLDWIRASASIPVMSKVVEIGDGRYVDGGVGDSIPVQYFEEQGYNRNVVILTQPLDFRKPPNKLMPIIRVTLRKYPKLVQALADRHIRYNETVDYIKEAEQAGTLFVIRPPEALNIKSTEKDPQELERVYQIGRETGEKYLAAVKEYLAK